MDVYKYVELRKKKLKELSKLSRIKVKTDNMITSITDELTAWDRALIHEEKKGKDEN